MISWKSNPRSRWVVSILLALFLAFGLVRTAALAESLGDIPLDPETYQRYLKTFPDNLRDALPTSYDARNDGIVTPAKDQGACGSCWAFASVGAVESHLLKKWGYGPTDLSEQQQVSCNTEMGGCVGGSSTALQWWDVPHNNGPIAENCFPYTATDTTPCSYSCADMVTRVTDWHTVAAADFKTSCYNEGPSYWRYVVYSDFAYNGTGYWYQAGPGDVYVNTGGFARGGHAVLIIGWDDAKKAYLCKNSWGQNAGPNGDGTFWIAYSGHVNNLGFGMANFDLVNNPQQDCDYCLTDTYGYDWCLNIITTDNKAYYLNGTCDIGGTVLGAHATYLYSTKGLTMTAYDGSITFSYNAPFISKTRASGVWVNAFGITGQVSVDKVECGAAADVEIPDEGPVPYPVNK